MRTLLPTSAATVGADGDDAAVRTRLYDVDRPAPAGRPWLMANMVAGIDGALTTGGRVGELSSGVDRALFVYLRSLADAVVVGASTVRAEGYGPVKLPGAVQEARVAAGRSALPPLVVVSASLRLDPDLPLFTAGDPPVIVTCEAAPADRRQALEAIADVVVAGDTTVDLLAALTVFRQRGWNLVLTEGGPTLLAEVVDAGLLDELCLTVAPVLGGDPFTMASRPHPAPQLARFSLESVAEHDGELYLRYLCDPGGPGVEGSTPT